MKAMSEITGYMVKLADEEYAEHEIWGFSPLEAAVTHARNLTMQGWRNNGEMTIHVEALDDDEETVHCINVEAAIATYEEVLFLNKELDKYKQLFMKEREINDRVVQAAEGVCEEFDIEMGQLNPEVVFESLAEVFREVVKANVETVQELLKAKEELRKLETIVEYLEGKLFN